MSEIEKELEKKADDQAAGGIDNSTTKGDLEREEKTNEDARE